MPLNRKAQNGVNISKITKQPIDQKTHINPETMAIFKNHLVRFEPLPDNQAIFPCTNKIANMHLQIFEISAIIIVLSALFGYVNARFLKLPNTIGLMIVSICFTGFLFASTIFTDFFLEIARRFIDQIDFREVLLDVMLGFLLFAGAMHTNFDQLRVQRWPVLVFSTLGVIVSTFVCAGLTYFGFRILSIEPKFIHCLLFGALISPTDPIAVLGILKQAGVPKILETKIVGESLFNDGVGVVVFLTIFSIASGPSATDHGSHANFQSPTESYSNVAFQDSSQPTSQSETVPPQANHHNDPDTAPVAAAPSVGEQIERVIKLFSWEVLGGILLGLTLGYLTFLLLRSIDDYEIEVLITLACVTGGYALATAMHLSAPLAMVVAGLIVGNDTVRGTAMSQQTEMYVNRFWELMDILLNAILFVLIGLELLVLSDSITLTFIYAAGMAIVIVLLSRFLSLLIPVRCFAKKLDFAPHTTTIMTWGGLRGGISIALALSLTTEMNRDLFLTVTYGVVIFSIIVQGLSVGKLAKSLIGIESNEAPESAETAH